MKKMEKSKEKKISEFLNRCDDDGNTLLHYVVQTDDEVFAEKLIAAGSNVNAKNHNGYLPLFFAIKQNQLKMVKILLNAGAKYDLTGRKTYLWSTPLHMAAENGNLEIVQLFIEMGVDVNSLDCWLSTALHCAARGNLYDGKKADNYCRIIKMLIYAGANIHAVREFGSTPILSAIEAGFYAGFELLLSFGADIVTDGKIDFKFLKLALKGGDLRILKRLLELGYDLNMKDNNGACCLHVATIHFSIKVTEFLLNNGVTMSVDNRGFDPLCYMIDNWCGHFMLNADPTFDHSELVEKYSKDSEQQMKFLIKHGANVNHVTNSGKTTLYIVLEKYTYLHSDVLRVLLKNGAKLDVDHPIVYTVMNSNGSKFSHLLLRHVATHKAQDRDDRPPNFDVNKLNKESRKDYARCRDELELMKATKVADETTVSFFDILVNRDIGPYTRNECIRNVFKEQSVSISSKFPVYSDLMVERFSEELEFQELLMKATDGLSRLLNWDKISMHIPLSNVLCNLSEKDLSNLALV